MKTTHAETEKRNSHSSRLRHWTVNMPRRRRIGSASEQHQQPIHNTNSINSDSSDSSSSDEDSLSDVDLTTDTDIHEDLSNIPSRPCYIPWLTILIVAIVCSALLALRFSAGLVIDGFDGGDQIDSDLYSLLDVPPSASQTTIKAAYRKIALQMHPDKCNNDICKGILERAMKAYEVLGNSERRKLYDISATTHEPIHSEAMDLTTEDFEKMLHDSDDLWIVQIYAEWSPHAARFGVKWENEVIKFKASPFLTAVKFARIHVVRQSELVLKLPLSIQINALPTVLSFLRARSTPWQRWLGNSMLGVWIGQQIPSSVIQIDSIEIPYFNTNQNQHVVVLATSSHSVPPNIYQALAFQFSSVFQFAHCNFDSKLSSSKVGNIPSHFPSVRLLHQNPTSTTPWSKKLNTNSLASSVLKMAVTTIVNFTETSIRSLCVDGNFACTFVCSDSASSEADIQTFKSSAIQAISKLSQDSSNLFLFGFTKIDPICNSLTARASTMVFISDQGSRVRTCEFSKLVGDTLTESLLNPGQGPCWTQQNLKIDVSSLRRTPFHSTFWMRHSDKLLGALVIFVVVILFKSFNHLQSSQFWILLAVASFMVSMLVQEGSLFKILSGVRDFD